MSDDPLTPEELAEFEALRAELTAVPGVEEGLRQQLYEESVNFLKVCVQTARRIQQIDNVWTARRIMTEVTIWAVELRDQMVKQTVVVKRPKSTSTAFKR